MKTCFGKRARYENRCFPGKSHSKIYFAGQRRNHVIVHFDRDFVVRQTSSTRHIGPRDASIKSVIRDGLFSQRKLRNRAQVVSARSTSLRPDCNDARQHAESPDWHEIVLILWGRALSMELFLLPTPHPVEITFFYGSELVRWTGIVFAEWMQWRRPSLWKNSRSLLDFVSARFISIACDVGSCVTG
jgi:hypothetical protein